LDEEQELGPEEASRYRLAVGSLIYAAGIRTDILYTVKELARGMSKPRKIDWMDLTRLGKYLLGTQDMVAKKEVPKATKIVDKVSDIKSAYDGDWNVEVYSDADWACVRADYRSTSGLVLKWCGCLVFAASRRLPGLPALSSGESELRALTRGVTEGIHTRRVLNEFGIDVKVRVKSDAQAALCNAAKLGPGRMRHLMTSATFVEDAVRRRMVILEKVGTDSNIADPMTKHLAREKHESFLNGLGIFPAHLVTPLVYNVQKQEKLNVFKDSTLVQAIDDQHDIVAGIYGEEPTLEKPSTHGGWMFRMMLIWAMIGILRTAVDICRALSVILRGRPQKEANTTIGVDVAHMGVGTSEVGQTEMERARSRRDALSEVLPTTMMSSSSAGPSQTYTRFTTVTRHAPIWHSGGGEKFHSTKNCRGLRGAAEVKMKTESRICGGGGVSSSTTRPADWEID
jgi:hypothetical protein